MHIVVNTRLLLPNKLDGIGWFSHEVLSRLTQNLPDWKFTFLFDRSFDQRFIYGPNVEGKVVFPPTRHPLLYQLYFQRSIPHKLKGLKADLFFSPDGFLSTHTQVKQVPVIHDLNFEHRPEDLPLAYRKYYRKYFPRFAKKAAHIITVSDYSAQDIHATYGIPKEKISVAHNGYNQAFHPISEADKVRTRKDLAHGSPYFIFVGNFSHRKNIHGIIRSFDQYRKKGGKHHLLLVGNPLWRYSEMDQALEQSPNKSAIHFTGRLEIDRLVNAMGAAEALLFPSYFEGFGIPVLEAFAAGIPVITSNGTSLPEVAGEGAILCDPDDHEKISSAMRMLEVDENQRFNLIKGGEIQLSSFSWEQTANKVQDTLFHCLNRV